MAQTDNQVMQHLDYACNRFGGRITGSDGYTNACNWAVDTFRSWGVKAELDLVGVEAVGFNRGPFFGKMIEPDEEFLVFGTPSYTAGTKGVQRGHVVIVPADNDEFEDMKDQIKGAWVLIEGTNSGWARDGGRRFSPSEMTLKITEAGALGTLQLTTYPIRLLEGKVESWEQLPTLPDIKLLDSQYNKIKEMVEDGEEVILELDIRNHFKKGPIEYHNVIAWIPGSEFPDEYVVMGGHFDAFDCATGAVDNGSGFTPAMEAIRMIAKAGGRPKRTIMVHLWAAEERGLVGSQSWIKKNPDKIPYIAACFNRDGGTNAIVGLSVSEAMYADFEKICAPLDGLNPDFPFELTKSQPRNRPTRAGGSDSSSFSMAGVPALGWRTQDVFDLGVSYGETWHTNLDSYNKVVPEYQEHTALAIALVVYGVGNLDHQLSREGYFLDGDEAQPTQQRRVIRESKIPYLIRN
ncbi:MAG: M20/M25/M40 family metallo-hydrolase [Planctomycetes bacterium]|nr:M20/M25/M40 family metallo-hydrolase [Planctomycetota bacterium]